MNTLSYRLKITSKKAGHCGLKRYGNNEGGELITGQDFEVGQTVEIIGESINVIEVDDTEQFEQVEQVHEMSREANEGENYRYELGEI